MNSAKIRDFRSKLTPGVIQTKKRHKTIRNGDHDLITNSIFMKLMFNYKMLSVGVVFLHLTVVILTAREAGRLLIAIDLGSEKSKR